MNSCSTCSSGLPEEARFCPSCGSAASGSTTPTRLDRDDGASDRQDVAGGGHVGRFVPGSTLAGRYRVIGLLGRGGMGEVYRADDLRLQQPVALKFLPGTLGQDPGRLARFHAEVRLARQVSHPNVCRVYDIGEADGQHFLSMEFVDGEDLESLLRRIGRLPPDKAIQFARQLCAGLAAAHDAGVLHRDLKPSNVMIDGRGRARITDFGLAAVAGAVRGAEARAGTPDYMSPEQLTGQGVTSRSDLYALGLILYEAFTGRSPFERGETLEDVARIRRSSTPKSPGSVLEGIDPAVERAILRCLEADPQRRPASAIAVSAALPGGDPLAAALAAGETPSPEMVAAAGREGALRPGFAWACLAAAALGLAVAVTLAPPRYLVNYVPMEKSPEVLAERAREVLRTLGHDAPARDSAFQFEEQSDYLRYLREHDKTPSRWNALSSGRPAAVFFWLRQSPDDLMARNSLSVVVLDDPPATVPGMATVRLDTRGRLIEFEAVPPAREQAGSSSPEPAWPALFTEAGLNMADFKAVPPVQVPRVFCDRRMAWQGRLPERPEVPIRLEAGAYGGRVVSFGIHGPWTASDPSVHDHTAGSKVEENLRVVLAIAAMVAGIVLARRNLRLGRGDRSGALKVMGYFIAVHLLVWVLWVDHVPDLGREWTIFSHDTGWTLFNAALVWLFYLGLEPYVRRRWPGTLVAWSRVLTRRFRDPLVGREILVGSVLGAFIVIMIGLSFRVPVWIGRPPDAPQLGNLLALKGLGSLLASILDLHVHGLLNVMQALLLMLMFSVFLRNEWLGALAFTVLFTLMVSADSDYPLLTAPLIGLGVGAFTIVLRRVGLLAGVVGVLWPSLITSGPITAGLTTWYAAPTIAALIFLGGVALYGFRVALAGRPALRLMAEEAA